MGELLSSPPLGSGEALEPTFSVGCCHGTLSINSSVLRSEEGKSAREKSLRVQKLVSMGGKGGTELGQSM